MKKNIVIAIDGPAGAGKSTIAKIIAKTLGILYIDSGAMYRAATYYLIKENLIKTSEEKIKSALKKIEIIFKFTNKEQHIFLNKKDVTSKIRTQEINKNVSYVASLSCVRKKLVEMQKNLGKNNSLIMDGRDIGTEVFKNANLKIYLTASSNERAKRRKKELDLTSEKISLNELIKDINRRDNLDSSRKLSPLSKANDAIVIDCTQMNIEEVVESILFFV